MSEILGLLIFDAGLTMKSHVKSIFKSAYSNYTTLTQLEKTPFNEAAATAIHAYITSRLDG